MHHRGTRTGLSRSFKKPSIMHRSWCSKYMPTVNGRILTSKGSRNPELISTGFGDTANEHLRGPLGPYSEISKANCTKAYGPDAILGNGEAFDFALDPQQSPKSPGKVHRQADRDKGISIGADVRIEHAGKR